MDIEKKIRKLLALSESPNEFEAQAALLKARQLMAGLKYVILLIFIQCVVKPLASAMGI